ncbi:uncharacterized protein H6S33_009891, partial [Morchella sextelata]|uniref:uncharacterized protein n=1 Tax=Morchella sextelata TaxID=1174677 RepID=UPI001D04DA4E
MFPSAALLGKRLQLGCYVNVRTLRDHAKREAFAAAEQTRQIHLAQHAPAAEAAHKGHDRAGADGHQHAAMKIKNRCIMGGKGRGVMRDFRVSR